MPADSQPAAALTRLLIADDHPLVLSGMETVLRHGDYEVVSRVQDGNGVLDAIADHDPDILVLDVNMPGRSGMDLLRALRGSGDERPIVLFTAMITDEALVEAIDLGVNGIVPKEGDEMMLVECLRAVEAGERWIEAGMQQRANRSYYRVRGRGADPLERLTPRERSIAALVARGLRNREIAAEIGVTEGSVKVYLHRMYEKLDIETRVELAMLVQGTDLRGNR